MNEEYIRKDNNEIDKLIKVMNLHHRAIFGDVDLNEKGMKEKVDTMYNILVTSSNVSGIFARIGGFSKTVLIIVGLIGLIKGWWIGLISATLTALNK
jgi:hypothetical protein